MRSYLQAPRPTKEFFFENLEDPNGIITIIMDVLEELFVIKMVADQSCCIGWWHIFTVSLEEVRHGDTRRLKQAVSKFLHPQVIRYARHILDKSSCPTLLKVAENRQASTDVMGPIAIVVRKIAISGANDDLQDAFAKAFVFSGFPS